MQEQTTTAGNSQEADVHESSKKSGSTNTYPSGDYIHGTIFDLPTDNLNSKDTIEYQLKKGNEYLDLHNLGTLGQAVTRDDLLILRKDEARHVIDLNLSSQGLTDVAIEPISGLKLKNLGLDKNQLKDLHALKGNPAIKSLRLMENPITSEGMRTIATLPNLQALELARTPIGDSDLVNLYRCKHMRYINLGACPKLTAPAVQRLRSKLPNAQIVFDEASEKKFKPGFDILTNIRATLMSQSEYDEADAATERTIAHWESEPNPPYVLIMQGYLQRADCQEKLKQPKAQAQMLVKWLVVAGQHAPDNIEIPSVECRCGKILESLDDKKSALAMCEKADAFWQKHPPDIVKRWEYLNNMRKVGYLIASPSQFRKARQYFERSSQVAQQYAPGDDRQIAGGKQGIAWCEFQAGNYKSAETLLKEVLPVYEKDHHDRDSVNGVTYMLAQCYAKQGDLKGAEVLLKNSLNTSISDRNRARACDGLANILEAQNKKEEAKHYSEIVYSLTGKKQLDSWGR